MNKTNNIVISPTIDTDFNKLETDFEVFCAELKKVPAAGGDPNYFTDPPRKSLIKDFSNNYPKIVDQIDKLVFATDSEIDEMIKEVKFSIRQYLKWKADYKNVITITDPITKDKCVIAKPNRKIVSFALSNSINNPLGMCEAIIENCWLYGDENLKQDDDFILGINSQIDTIINIKNLELKKA